MYLDSTSFSIYFLNKETNTWDSVVSTTNTSKGIFQGYDGRIYLFDDDVTNYAFAIIEKSGLNHILTITSPSPSGGFLGAYKTMQGFYVWYDATLQSIYKIQNNNIICYNQTVPVGNSLSQVAVTDDGKIFLIVNEFGLFRLKQIISDDNYPVLSSFGPDGTFKIDSLDDNHLVITSHGNTSGYNGLFIYNISERKIEKFITTEDVIALYVPRF